MTIFINNKSTKFCQITLRVKRFIRKRKVVPFFLLHGVYTTHSFSYCLTAVLSIRLFAFFGAYTAYH